MAKKKKRKYIHGYDKKEQKRLYAQADFLEPYIYQGLDLRKVKHLLEVGCGVGAQTKWLLKHFPHLQITGVDISHEQLAQARHHLRREIARGQVRFLQADATRMEFPDGSFDGAFLCWFLEHVPEPLLVLKEVRRVLKRQSPIVCSEVFNQTFFVEPYSPAMIKYWFEFNDHQWKLGGHPFVGASLGNLLKEAGFRKVQTESRPFHFDSRESARRADFIKYFGEIFLSAADLLVEEKRVTSRLVLSMKAEIQKVARAKNSVFYYTWMRAYAKA